MSMQRRLFSLDEARSELPALRRAAAEVIDLRAQLVDLTQRQREGDPAVALADVKGIEARLSEILDGFTASGVEVKGFAPLLLDFPSIIDGRDVLLCWLEGETDITWFHFREHGFAGRRPLST